MVGCAPTAHTADAPPAGAELTRPIESLRIRLAADPGDPALNLALARALDRAGRPGGAIRHYEEVLRHRTLAAADRGALARLYVERARARLALGDGDARRDLERAAGQGGRVPAELEREALFAGALAALRRADRPGRDAARELLGRAARIAASDPRLAAREPERAALSAVAEAGAWLADGGARRAALEVYEVYVARGGRAPEHARRYLALHRWWYGDRERPSGLLLRELAAAGVDLCDVARDAAEPRCAARSVAMALDAWVEGEIASWSDEVRARVDLAALVKSGAALPPEAAPTLWRAAGKTTRAAYALDQLAARAADLTPEARTLAVAEASDAGRSDELIDRLLASGATLPAGWRAALRAARERDAGGPREAALCDRAPLATCAAHLRQAGELGALAARAPSPALDAALARWNGALDHPRLRAGREAALVRWQRLAANPRPPERDLLPLGTVDVYRLGGERRAAAALAQIARAYLRSPASAERLAEDFADGAPALGQRGLLVASLFGALGDPARAWQWAESVNRSSPDHAPYAMAAGAMSVAAGAVDRADVFFTFAAQASGDAGAASVEAARIFLAHGFPLPALAAARRAVQLTAAGQPEHEEAVRLAARAMDLLGRAADARRLRAGERVSAEAPSAPLGFPPVDSAAWRAAVADRLARALLAPSEQAQRLFTALADELDAAGLHSVATACRREARSITR